jgi:hypothetical protein
MTGSETRPRNTRPSPWVQTRVSRSTASRSLCGQLGDAPRMADAQGRIEVGEIGKGSERPVQLVVGQCRTELWVERNHLITRRDCPEPVEDLGMAGAEAVDKVGIELRAAPLTGHAHCSLRATGVMERLDTVRQLDQADGRREFVGADRTWYSSPVPSLE